MISGPPPAPRSPEGAKSSSAPSPTADTTHSPAPSITAGAILLAGGRAERMGGVDKPSLVVGGMSMLQRCIDACISSGSAPIVVVGPDPESAPAAHVHWIREDPPFTGPAAAVIAALAAWEPWPDWTFALACDLPRVDDAVAQLLRDMMLLPSDTDGICLADASSRPQWLIGAYRTGALRAAAASMNDEGRNASVRALLGDLAIAVVAASDDITRDVDTWEDLDRARVAAHDRGERA